MGFTVIPVVIAPGIFEWIRYQESYNKLLNKLDALSSSQSLLLAEPPWNDNRDQIFLNSATLISDPDVIFVRIINADHITVYSYGELPETINQLFHKRSISYVNDIKIETIGSIELALSDKQITSNIKQRLYERSLMLGIFLFIVLCAYFALQVTVGKALKKMLTSIKQADEEGILAPVQWTSNDEIGRVISAYNSMQARQKQDANKLLEAQAQLEQRIEERTHLLSQEISTRKKVESELRKQDQELQTFLNGVPVMLWMLGTDGKTMHYNDSWLRFTGLTQSQEDQLDWKGGDIHQDYRSQCIQTYQSCIEKKKPFSQEYLKQNSEGKYRWISETGLPRYDNNGQYLGYFGTCVDITPSKEAEQLLFEEKERAQITLTSIGEGVITTDADCNVQFLNPIAEKILGYSLQQVIGKSLPTVLNIFDEITHKPIENPSASCLKQKLT